MLLLLLLLLLLSLLEEALSERLLKPSLLLWSTSMHQTTVCVYFIWLAQFLNWINHQSLNQFYLSDLYGSGILFGEGDKIITCGHVVRNFHKFRTSSVYRSKTIEVWLILLLSILIIIMCIDCCSSLGLVWHVMSIVQRLSFKDNWGVDLSLSQLRFFLFQKKTWLKLNN